VLLSAVVHGAGNAWLSYIDISAGSFGGIMALSIVSLIVSIIIVLMADRPTFPAQTQERT